MLCIHTHTGRLTKVTFFEVKPYAENDFFYNCEIQPQASVNETEGASFHYEATVHSHQRYLCPRQPRDPERR